jgi:inhibitor of KinA sporulation pathway (predicted exonuclease)
MSLFERPSRRMTLRQQMTHVEKLSRDLIDHINSTLVANLTDLRELSRPVRKKSHYPTLVAMSNSLNKVAQCSAETTEFLDYLQEQLQEIRDHAQRERLTWR